MNPFISIGMPVFNCEKTLRSAVASIQRQTWKAWELIIIDDGSSDRTVQVAQTIDDDRIRLFARPRNEGLPTRLNEAISLSRGEYFARMDGDDIMYPRRLEVQLRELEKSPYVDVLGGAMMIFAGDGDAIGIQPSRITHDQVCGHAWNACYLAHNTWMGRTEWFSRNRYREDARCTQDRELLLRTRHTSRFAGIPDVLVGYRQDGISLRKSLRAHLQFSRSLVREGIRQREYLHGVVGVLAELSKFGLDVAAVASGLNYKLLRHRARTPADDEAQFWRGLWVSLHEPACRPQTQVRA